MHIERMIAQYGTYSRRGPAKDKRIEIGLTYVYGIGRTSALKFWKKELIRQESEGPHTKRKSGFMIIDHEYIVETSQKDSCTR